MQSQNKVKEENQWLTELRHLMLSRDFIVTVTPFVSLVQAHQGDKEIQSINWRVGRIKLLIGIHLICDSFLC